MNLYNQAPHLTQDTNGKVTTLQLDIPNERSALSQQVTTTHQQTYVHESITKQDRSNTNDPQKKHHLGTVSKKYFTGGLKPAPTISSIDKSLSGNRHRV